MFCFLGSPLIGLPQPGGQKLQPHWGGGERHHHHKGDSDSGGGDDEEEKIFQRYYHVFQEGELEGLVKQVEGLSISHSYYDQGNWCVVAEKI